MVEQHRRHRQRRAGQRAHHAVFTVDGMGRRQHGAGRLLAQHEPAVVVADEERGVGLPAADGHQAHGAGQAADLAPQEGVERRGVERLHAPAARRVQP
ncbi:MAG: hypothetical protein QM750_14880 [Rubrivivax sp.]